MGDNYLKKTLNTPVCLVCSSEMIVQRIPKSSRKLRQNMFEFRFKRKTAVMFKRRIYLTNDVVLRKRYQLITNMQDQFVCQSKKSGC